MKCVKCYGRAKFTTVDSSFKRKFFESFDSKNSVGSNSFEEFQQKGSNSFASVSSTSDYINIHSHELFTSETDSFNGNLPTFSPCSSRNARRKHKSVKHFVTSKTCPLNKYFNTSVIHSSADLQPVLTNKAKKPLNKHTRASKSCVKQRISNKLKLPVELTSSYSSRADPGLSYAKCRSKNARHLYSYKKGTLKRKPKTSHHHRLKKHSSIPIKPSSDFCENSLSVINTGVKKINKKVGWKQKQLINKAHDVITSNCFGIDMVPPFDSKHDSFWASIQPRWSSIYEYSFEIENTSKERKKTIERQLNNNADFVDLIGKENGLLSSKGSISGGILFQSEGSIDCKHPLAAEKIKSTDKVYLAENDNFSKQGNDLNANSSKTIDSKLKAARNISENLTVCKKSSAIIYPYSVNSQTFLDIENVEIQHTSDKIALIVSDMCETLSEKLNVNDVVAVNKVESTSQAKGKILETYEEEIRRKSNEDFMSATQTSFPASKTISEKRNQENVCLSENLDQLQEYTLSVSSKKSNDFYSLTPLESPSTHVTLEKFCPSNRAFSPVFKKDVFVTSTPTLSSKTQKNQICNMSFENLSFDSSVKLQRCPEISSSVLSRRNKTHASSAHHPFINSSSQSNENIHHPTSRSCISISRREQLTMGESQSWAKSCSLSNKALYSSVTSTNAESDFESTLSNLLEFCGQIRIIPFNELYDWSHTTVRKIGEGTYGEVFTLVQNKISSVVKVIPFSEEDAGHSMQSIESVLSEVTVSQCLSELRNNKSNKTRNFNKLKSVHLVRGCYPDQMLVAWDKFSVAKSTYNSRPDIFNDQQMFAIIELEYGGKDMTCFMLRNAAEAESVFKQIAISLAIAEEVHLFEHRDLHLGNILVQRNARKTISYVLRGKAFSIPNHGLVVTIIDFTLSRVLHEGCIFYNDLADDSLFNQTGDYQFQIYKDTKFHLNNEWHKCLLYSNVLWLTYLLVKLLEYNYSRPSSKKHHESLNNMKTIQNNLRSCQNAFECVTTCNLVTSVPNNEQGSSKKMAMKAKFVDRKSTKIHLASYL